MDNKVYTYDSWEQYQLISSLRLLTHHAYFRYYTVIKTS